MLLFLLLVIGVAAVGGLWPGACGGGRRLSPRQLVLHRAATTRSRSARARTSSRSSSSSPSARSSALRRARRAPGGRRAHEPAPKPRRSRGSPARHRSRQCSMASAACSGSRARRVLHRQERGWRIEAASGDRVPESPEASDRDDRGRLRARARPRRAARSAARISRARRLRARARGVAPARGARGGGATAGTLSAANELRTALLSAVSHDLRTPLSAIKASVTSLLQQDVDWTPEARHEFLATINEETDRLNALVGNLLDMSRLQAGALESAPQPVGLDEVLPAALRSLGVPAARSARRPETLPRVLADRGLLDARSPTSSRTRSASRRRPPLRA